MEPAVAPPARRRKTIPPASLASPAFCICTLLQRTAISFYECIPLYTALQKEALSPSLTKQRTRNHRPVAFCCTLEQRTNTILATCFGEPPDEADDKGQDERQEESDKDD